MLSDTWTTLITTADYGEGVVCLAQSLLLVKSKHRLTCFVTCDAARQGIVDAASRDGGSFPSNLDISDLSSTSALMDEHFHKDASQDPSCFIDAPRRALFLLDSPFIYLDSDMIIVQNIDDLFEYLTTAAQSASDNIYAVPNFRNKRKCYSVGGNFNAGLMVIPHPGRKDYEEMMRMLNAGYNDTEEKLFNEIFRNRYHPLPFGYNSQKRCFSFAPPLWDEVKDSELGIKVIHYVGYKPWQSPADLCRLDWEFAAVDKSSAESMAAGCAAVCAPYKPVTDLWHIVRGSKIHDPPSAEAYLAGLIGGEGGSGRCVVSIPSAVSFFSRPKSSSV